MIQKLLATWGNPPAASRFFPLADRVLSREGDFARLSDDEIRRRSRSLQYQARSGQPTSRFLIEGFALVREAARRRLQLQHYRVQLVGGAAMHYGAIAVMQTGEGKTLTATLPTYLAALSGDGAHVATANDYLAARDADYVRPLFDLLGMSVGVIQSNSSQAQRLDAYRCDITYATAKEIGFDFLRDRLSRRRQMHASGQRLAVMSGHGQSNGEIVAVQRDFHFLLVDEADSILIDEARTPLIVSAMPSDSEQREAQLYEWAAENASRFVENEHFRVVPENDQIELTEAGRKFARSLPLPTAVADVPLPDLYLFVQRAIYVNRQYHRDRHYVVDDDQIVIIDEYTGRPADGRKWRSGLHQAIEAREGLPISPDTGDAAKVTIQDLCLQYPSICGMTGTVASSGRELKKIYKLRAEEILTNRPAQRMRLADRILGSDAEKWKTIVQETNEMQRKGRPVLIGTRSIDKSERLSQLLQQAGIKHAVLNARNLEREAEIIAAAGQSGRVVVATNMAGRGTDIKLEEGARQLGGLHVICSELHDSARIDRQLIGRCGRQGDPGSYRRYMSLDDDILRIGLGAKRAARLKQLASAKPRDLRSLSRIFEAAQRRVERSHYRSRRMLLFRSRQRQQLQREMGLDPYLDSPSEDA